MSDLRTAAQKALEYMKSVGKMDMHPEEWAIVERLEAALAVPVQEPVQQALVEADRIMGHDNEATEWRERWAHLFGVAGIPVQEPVAWMDVLENGYKCLAGRPIQGWTPLYTAPPQRKPLSGIEVERLLEQVIGSLHVARKLVRAAELAHGIGAKP